MVNILLNNGMQNGNDSKTHHVMNSLVSRHAHRHIELEYGLTFAWLSSVQNFFKIHIPVLIYI